jgi:antitoxin component YwqK of YwqJK toxin-antitoxin module
MYHENGTLMIEGSYRDGMFDGEWVYYNEFGFKIGEGSYNMGNGVQRAFHLNGKLWKEIPYRNSLRNGTEKTYNQVGVVVSSVEYADDVPIATSEKEE